MKERKLLQISVVLVFLCLSVKSQNVDLSPEIQTYEPFIWPSEIPADCSFKQSEELDEIKFLGIKSGYRYGDTWYPTWASNDTL